MTYPSFESFAKDQVGLFNQLRDVDKVLRTALLDSLVLIKDRVQQKGEKSDGSQIGTYSDKGNAGKIARSFGSIANQRQQRAGGFSGSYKEFRQRLGRQTAYVDLTLTGDMLRNFTIIPISQNSLGIGFTSDKEAVKARKNEQHFGGPIFDLSADEEKFINDAIETKVNAIFAQIP